MIKKIAFTTVALSTILLTGCGGGGSDNTTPVTNPTTNPTTTTQEKLKLTIDNVTLDSTSSISRVSKIYSINTQILQKISTNHDAIITIEGKDADLFELKNTAFGKQLKFRNSTQIGEYEVDIKASDSNGNSVIYKVKYIIKESSIKKELLGKTLYVTNKKELEEGTYLAYTFNDEIMKISTYKLENDELQDEKTIPLEYKIGYFDTLVTTLDGKERECTLRHYGQYSFYVHKYQLECLNERRVFQDKFFFTENKEDGKRYIILTRKDRELSSKDISNNENNAPKITSFRIDSNKYINNNKAELDNYFSYGKNKIWINMDKALTNGQQIYLFFQTDTASNITSTGNQLTITGDKKDQLIYMTVKESGKFEYSTLGQKQTVDDTQKFSSFPADAYLNLFVCEDATLSLDTCNYASIPVKLY